MVARVEVKDPRVVTIFKKEELGKGKRIIELRNPVPGDTDHEATQSKGMPFVMITHPNGTDTTVIETGLNSTSVQNRVDGKIPADGSLLISGNKEANNPNLTHDICDRKGNILATVTHIINSPEKSEGK